MKPNGVGGGMCLKASTQSDDSVIVRQCANYQPPMWKDDFIQSLHNGFGVCIYAFFSFWSFQYYSYDTENKELSKPIEPKIFFYFII